ncbi:MAG TPA: HAMP domain-containing sensor histidine kinase [Chloroflexota bacterium]|jgi:signal transduction histidine kinase
MAVLGHELRAPLAALRATVEVLGNDPESDGMTTGELIRRLARSVGWLEGLVENMTLWAMLEDGQMALRTQPVALRAVVDDAVGLVTPLLERKRQSVRITCQGPGPAVAADRQRLGRAVVNLLANAGTYGPAGQEILIAIESAPGWAEVRVIDQGPGVAPRERNRIWNRYTRGRVAREEGAPGMGLGLHIVQELVRMHGGDVGVEAAPAGGAAFWIRLPVATEAKL